MGMRPVTATMVPAPACWARTVGSLVRPGASRHPERSGAFCESSVSGSARVVTVNSRFAFGRIAVQYRRCRDWRVLFRPWAAHWSPYGRSRQRWRQSAVAFRPTSDARNRRVPADTLRGAVQSAYGHTPRAACQHRTAADGGHTMNGPLCRLQSNLRLQRQTNPWPPVMRRHVACAASPLPWRCPQAGGADAALHPLSRSRARHRRYALHSQSKRFVAMADGVRRCHTRASRAAIWIE
jgi:hypothetical protein